MVVTLSSYTQIRSGKVSSSIFINKAIRTLTIISTAVLLYEMFNVESVEFNLVIRGDGWWAHRGVSAECHEYSVRSCAGQSYVS